MILSTPGLARAGSLVVLVLVLPPASIIWGVSRVWPGDGSGFQPLGVWGSWTQGWYRARLWRSTGRRRRRCHGSESVGGHRGLGAPSALWRFTHLSDDETVAKMGHPVRWLVEGVRSFASANDTPPYRKVRERVGHLVRWLFSRTSESMDRAPGKKRTSAAKAALQLWLLRHG
jgi:hypothetical protein